MADVVRVAGDDIARLHVAEVLVAAVRVPVVRVGRAADEDHGEVVTVGRPRDAAGVGLHQLGVSLGALTVEGCVGKGRVGLAGDDDVLVDRLLVRRHDDGLDDLRGVRVGVVVDEDLFGDLGHLG